MFLWNTANLESEVSLDCYINEYGSGSLAETTPRWAYDTLRRYKTSYVLTFLCKLKVCQVLLFEKAKILTLSLILPKILI